MRVEVQPNQHVKFEDTVYAGGTQFDVPEDQAAQLLEVGAVVQVKDAAPTEGEVSGPSIAELRARAKELNLSAGGSKEELAKRIAEAEAVPAPSAPTEGQEGGKESETSTETPEGSESAQA